MATGRNQPCPCGSARKYKRCCGNPLKMSLKGIHRPTESRVADGIAKALEHHKASELIRCQQQGLGKPIISTEHQGRRLVAVGNKVYHSTKFKTFPDFLFAYVKGKLGSEWGNAEIVKPLEERHIILQWYNEYYLFQKRHFDKDHEIQSFPATGVVNCYLGLAYSLYLLEHNVELQDRLLKRLKDSANFQGAYYELIVANCLIRAGFDLVLEDETDRASKHCEFSAVSQKTGKKYWVEAKMRAVSGILGKSDHDGTQSLEPTSSLIQHVNKALAKPAADERLIFIDLNTDPPDVQSLPDWMERAAQKLEGLEKTYQKGERAYIFVTNMEFHRRLTDARPAGAVLVHGFGIPDFGRPGEYRLTEIYRKRQKHKDAYHIFEAVKEYPKFPSTFDGSLPSETFGDGGGRIIIGETYFFPDMDEKGITGTVTSAMVSETEKTEHLGITTKDNGSFILSRPMTEAELTDYKNHPEAFFGVILQPPGNANDPYELFEFFVGCYKNSSKEKLLEFLKDSQDTDSIAALPHMDLVLEYCERLVAAAVAGQENR